jgi:hypothetical protein
MASEILRQPERNKALPANMQSITTGIAKAAISQAKEAIATAVQSFNSIKEKQVDFIGLDEAFIQGAAFAESPAKYLAQVYMSVKPENEIVPIADVFARLRQHEPHSRQGLASFLKSGIQEALEGLKIQMDPNLERPLIPIPLDELITAEKLRNPDKKKLQASVQVINEMFKTLRNIQGDVSDLQLKMLLNVRA